MHLLPIDGVDQSIDIFIQDSSSTIGAGLTGLAYNTASLVAYYRRGHTGTPTAITLATLANAQAAHSDGGFVEISSANEPGLYRLDLPDAVIVAGVPRGQIMLKGATNMVPCPVGFILGSPLGSNVVAGMTEFFDTHRQWTAGIIGVVTSASVFRVVLALDTAANSFKYQEVTLIRSSGVRERQRIASHTRVDATHIEVTLANAFASVPVATTDICMIV